MARAQQVRAIDLHQRGIVDRIVAEHPDAADEPEEFCRRIGAVLEHELAGPAPQRPVRRPNELAATSDRDRAATWSATRRRTASASAPVASTMNPPKISQPSTVAPATAVASALPGSPPRHRPENSSVVEAVPGIAASGASSTALTSARQYVGRAASTSSSRATTSPGA